MGTKFVLVQLSTHDLDPLGSHDIIGHMAIRLMVVDFLWVVHCDHASIWRRYGDMAPQQIMGSRP